MGKGDTHTKKHTKSKFVKYELEIAKKEEGDFYAKVQGVLNGNRINVINTNNEEFQVIIRGNFYFGKKKENLNFVDPDRNEYWVLVQLGISKNQYFLKHIYNDSDCKKLQDRGELALTVASNNTINIGKIDNIDIVKDDDNWLDNV
jgi:hypothetical protein